MIPPSPGQYARLVKLYHDFRSLTSEQRRLRMESLSPADMPLRPRLEKMLAVDDRPVLIRPAAEELAEELAAPEFDARSVEAPVDPEVSATVGEHIPQDLARPTSPEIGRWIGVAVAMLVVVAILACGFLWLRSASHG
jgi:hypothetical protein